MDDCHSPDSARILITADAWRACLADPEALAARAVAATLAMAAPDLAEPCVVDLMLADDAALRELNRTWRGKDQPTNVLSFPGDADQPLPPGEPRHLGDVAIAVETVTREAVESGRSVADHLAHMVVHGVLHLLGHDHLVEADAERMEALERRILAEFGIADPYAGERAA